MLDTVKSIIGVGSAVTDYDLYLVIIITIALMWAVKSVISCLITTITNIFR